MGLENLIYAIKILKEKEYLNLFFIIGGRGSLDGELNLLAKNLSLEKMLRFEGYINDEKLPLYYKASDAFILPTKELGGSSRVDLQACKLGTGRRFTTS
jgi:Glycosyltransferase